MKPILACLILFLLGTAITYSKPVQVKVENLKCEYLPDPIAIESQHPILSWQMVSGDNGKSQKAYRVIVAGSPVLLAQNKGDYWDSGIVHSTNSIQVSYQGKALASRKMVYWKVMIWDEKNQPSAWGPTASWGMGLLLPSNWKGKWIGAFEDPHPDSALTYPAPFFRKEFVTNKKIKKATVYVSGLGFYELYLNGKKIGDQVLAPAVTNYDKRPLKKLLYHYDDQSTQRVLYNTFDVTANITPNNNAIGILLGNGWYNQRDRTIEGTLWYDLPKVIFQLEITFTDGTTKTIVSDNTWKTTTGPLIKDGIFTGEKYDARLALGGWNKASYRDVSWKRAVFVKPPTGALQPQLAPFDKVTRTLKPAFDGKVKDSIYRYHLYETVSKSGTLSKRATITASLTPTF
jgi:alpha-L-rhamnosidase